MEHCSIQTSNRTAASIIHAACRSGVLSREKILLDSSSGNTGIGYAWISAKMGIRVHLVVSEAITEERKKILFALGVKLIFSDKAGGSVGARRMAREIAKNDDGENYYYANQYDNEWNWRAHYATMGPEIWKRLGGNVSVLVAGMGTAGTIRGTAVFLKEKNPLMRAVAVASDSNVEGLLDYSSPDFLTPGIYLPGIVDKTIRIPTEEAMTIMRRCAVEEGIMVGESSAVALAAGAEVAGNLPDSENVVVILPDGAWKYLSRNAWS